VGSERNFDGDIEQVMACLAELGIGGCGFEQQLGSVRRALGGDEDGAPRENADFLRDEASLAIILLTDEDDCSAPDGSDLHDTAQHLISDPLGPLDSYRCNEFGHLCGGVPPPRTMAARGLADCRSAEDRGKLVPVAEFVTFLQSLKAKPEDVMVAAITGPPTPYDVVLREKTDPVNRQRQLVPEIEPSCSSSNGAAAPAVRLNELVAAFGERGTIQSICADDFSPAMKKIGDEIARRASVQCLEGPVVDLDPAPGLQANCEVFEQTSTADGLVRSLIPSCETSAPPCWRLQISRDCVKSSARMSVDRAGRPAPPQTRTTVLCETCEKTDDPRCRF
jgi:hypothetical protein